MSQPSLTFTFASSYDTQLCSLFCAEVLSHVCTVQHMSGHNCNCPGCIQLLCLIVDTYRRWGARIIKQSQPSIWHAPELHTKFAGDLQLGKQMAAATVFTTRNLITIFKDKTSLGLANRDLLYNLCTLFQTRRLPRSLTPTN